MPRKLPAGPGSNAGEAEEIRRIYFAAGSNFFDLQEGKFVFTLFDSPAAVATRTDARYLGKDDEFYYFESAGYDPKEKIRWAFTIEPSGAFEGHRVCRFTTASGWEELSEPIYMTAPR